MNLGRKPLARRREGSKMVEILQVFAWVVCLAAGFTVCWAIAHEERVDE